MKRVCLWVALLMVVPVWAVSAQTLSTDPYPLEIAVGEEGSVDLVLDSSLPNGLKSYAIVLSDENESITGITLPDWCQLDAVEEKDYGWYVQCLDTNDEITEEDTNVTLATISVSGVVAGSSDLFIQTVGSTPEGYILGVKDDNNQTMFEDNVTIDDAFVVVTTAPPGAKNIIKFDYGAIVKVEVISVPEPGEDTIIQVVSETTGETVFSETISGTGSLDITGLEPGNYYMKVINAGNILNTSDWNTWDKKSVGADFVEIGDGNFDVKIKGASDVEWVNDEAPLIIQICSVEN